ncbi:hypothetical protein PENFLA_c001G03350 [Penicillium flavigenum]|uniref:Uncharacterized protein n=1 Tax=Penicillium flavigenum TaxID=254877 RepID=A0A1V6U294_9EURO|nr:hypothetical protein PENFLA_c001G03350 [Penicillium flavigenum]
MSGTDISPTAHAERGEDRIIDQNVINNYFIGPRASNMPDFRANINTVLDELLETRLGYYPEDNILFFVVFCEFQKVRDNFGDVVRKVAQLLGEHSVPFWSPRYEAHMGTDLTMPSLLGYFMTMLYNPNNVSLEASPITTVAELKSWGHITCDGTVANLESIWVARNLKYYPLALSQAINKGSLNFNKDLFKVETCKDGKKNFANLETWDLLNLKPEMVLDLPDQLYKRFGISSDHLKDALDKYNIQPAGLVPDETDQLYKNLKPMKYLVAKTRHYSWPKGLAIAGLGSGNLLEFDVDDDAHIDTAQLESKLNDFSETRCQSMRFSPKPEKVIHACDLSGGLILALTDHRESAMQPFPARVSARKTDDTPDTFFFSKGRTFDVAVWKDPKKNVDKGPGLLKDIDELSKIPNVLNAKYKG